MIQKNKPLSSTDFSKGLVTRSDIIKNDPNQSPNCIDIKWFFDGSIGKRMGSSTTNTIAVGSTSVSGWTLDSSGTLTTGLQAYWKLEEATDTRFDSFDGVNLTAVNMTGNIVGIRGQAALFSLGQSSILFASNTGAIQSGNTNFSISTWFFLNSTSQSVQTLVSKMPVQIDTATTLLLHMDGPEGSSVIPDSGISNYSITTGAGANLTISQSKFGGASCVFSGTAAWISAVDNPDWRLDGGTATNSWTIDFWVRFNSLNTRIALIQQYSSEAFGWVVYVGNGVTLAYRNSGATVSEGGGNQFQTGQWYHVAIVNSNGTVLNFVDGSIVASGAATAIPDITAPLSVGSGLSIFPVNGFDGWIDELRVSKGIARWNSAFTAPSLPYGSRDYEYNLFINTDNVVTFRVSSSGIAQDATVRATSFGAVTTSNWINVIAWHSNNSHIGISVNLSANTSPYTSGVKIGSAPFSLGAISNNLIFSDTRIDETGYWKKVLSIGERRDLFGGGTGNTFTQGASGFGWGMFDFGAFGTRWLTVAAGTGIVASSNLGTTFVTIATSRTQNYQSFERSKNVLIATSDAYDPTLFWAGSTGTFAQILANNSAPAAKYSVNYQGFLVLLNYTNSNGVISPRGFAYADENLQLTDAWNNHFDFPSSSDDEITSSFILNKFLYVSTRYKIFRVAFVGGNPDWSFLKVKDYGYVPRTVKIMTLKGSTVAIGMDWQRRIRVFDGFDDLFISDNVENDNNYCDFAMNKVSYAGSGLVYSHAEFDQIEQEYRLNLVIGANSTNTTHGVLINGRTLAIYPYQNQLYQAMCIAESNNQQHLMAVDRSGFVHILNSGNLDVSQPIRDLYDSPILFPESHLQVSKAQQMNFFFNVHSSGTIYHQDRTDMSSVFGPQHALRDRNGNVQLTGNEQVLQILRTVDVPATYNTYQFRLTSSAGTAQPWELTKWDFVQKAGGLGMGK